jgi:propionyl-CoA carboxylase beta chain
MGPKGAVEIIYKREIQKAKDPAAAQAKFEADYKARFANPYSAAERGYVDDVILPRTTRPRLIQALRLLGNKREELPRRKHGNIPL